MAFSMLSKFKDSLYSILLEFNDTRVVEWARNVYGKVKQDGILPKYIERDKQEDIVNIGIDRDLFLESLEVNDNFTFGRCISNMDLPLQKEVNIGTVHTVEFEVSSVGFAKFRLLVGDDSYIGVEEDRIVYRCAGEELEFSPVSYQVISKVKITRNNFLVTCAVDGVQVGQLSLSTNGEFRCIDLLRCSEKIEIEVKYGFLYNWYAATDVRNIASAGWHIPVPNEINILGTFLDSSGNLFSGFPVAGGKLKETGFVYWSAPNTGATNEVGFNGRGGGVRETEYMSKDLMFTFRVIDGIKEVVMYHNTAFLYFQDSFTSVGRSIRLIKDFTSLVHGQFGTYIGNDGKVYRTICIGTQEWLADNLAETKYRDGSWILGYDGGIYTPIDNATWLGLTSGALCVYGDDLNNGVNILSVSKVSAKVSNIKVTRNE